MQRFSKFLFYYISKISFFTKYAKFMNVSLGNKNVRTTGKVDIKGILCGKITFAKLFVTLKKQWEREEKDTIVLKFNNNNFLILSRRSFVLRSFRFVGNNFDSIFHSYVQRKSFYDTCFLLYRQCDMIEASAQKYLYQLIVSCLCFVS